LRAGPEKMDRVISENVVPFC